jgi:tetratricopeptide (TPR) repeat protein
MYSRGNVLEHLGCYEDAIASYNLALKIKPQDDSSWYNKACCYAVLGNVKKAVESLRKAIKLSPNQYLQLAKTEADFDEIRNDVDFCMLVSR